LITGGTTTKTSLPLYPYPTDNTTTIKFNSVIINGTTYPGPFTIVYSKPLEVGKAYTLQVNFRNALGGTADRITIGGTGSPMLAITRDPNDPGLFFKFGSVVGITYFTDNFGTNLSYIVFNPLSNPGAITGYGDNSFTLPAIPGYTTADWNTNNIKNVSLNTYHNLANIRAGKGDPCRLVGMLLYEIAGFADDNALYTREAELKAQGIGGWRLPTNLENQRFSGQSGNVSTTQHWWDATNSPVSPFGIPPVNGGEFPTRNSNNGSPDSAKFLPSYGYIGANGTMWPFGVAQSIAYWSSEPADFQYRYNLSFSPTSINPSATHFQAQGYNVRCVRDDSGITISGEDWDNGGQIGGTGGEGDIILP
jgi:hypothetical protein